MKKKIKKGDYGYIHSEKIRRLLITAGLFLLPICAYIGGIIVTDTKKNIITVIAMVGLLPACKSMVGLIMMMMQKSMKRKVRAILQQDVLWRVGVQEKNSLTLSMPYSMSHLRMMVSTNCA